jgi:HEAT repeat protein
MGSTYYLVRMAAVEGVSAYGEEAVDALLEMIHTCLVPLGPLVRQATDRESKRLRLRAIRALGEIGSAAAIRPLKGLLEDGEGEVAAAAQAALSRIGLTTWGRHGAVMALGNIASLRALPALIKALEDDSAYVRSEAARSLAKLEDPRPIPNLIDLLEMDEVPGVRREAAAALRALAAQAPQVAQAFRLALQDSLWEVRAEAARALGRIDDEDSIPPLLAALEDRSVTVVTSAIHALANLGSLALEPLLELAAGPDGPRRGPAVAALREMAPRKIKPTLAELLHAPAADRPRAVAALRRKLASGEDPDR